MAKMVVQVSTFQFVNGGGPGALHGKTELAGSSTALAFKFQRNKMFLTRSLVMIQYCEEPP